MSKFVIPFKASLSLKVFMVKYAIKIINSCLKLYVIKCIVEYDEIMQTLQVILYCIVQSYWQNSN